MLLDNQKCYHLKISVFINKAKVLFKVTQGISQTYITEVFQIKGCKREDIMSLYSD